MKKIYMILALAMISVWSWAEVSITVNPKVIDFGTVELDTKTGAEDSIAFVVSYSGLQEYCGVVYEFVEAPEDDAAFWISGSEYDEWIYGGDEWTEPEGNDMKVHFYATATGLFTAKVAFYSYEDDYWEVETEKVYMNIRVNVVDKPTGLEDTKAAIKAHKQIINGQMYIVRGEHLYDMTGAQIR